MSNSDAVMRWHREHLRQFKFNLNIETESDLIDWLDGIENKQGYIKELIRADMEKSRQ